MPVPQRPNGGISPARRIVAEAIKGKPIPKPASKPTSKDGGGKK